MSFGRLPADVVDRLLGKLSPQKLGKGASTAARIDMEGVEVTVPDELQWASAPFPEIAAGPGQAVLIRGKDPAHYVLTDPDFLDNAAMKDPAKAAGALALIGSLRGDNSSVMLDLTLYGAGRGYDLGKLLVEPPFLALTLTISLPRALAFLHGLGRFGPALPAVRAIPFGKGALVNTTAMLLRRAGRIDGLGPRYAALMRGRAAQLLGAPQGLQGEALDRWLDFARQGHGTCLRLACRGGAVRPQRARHAGRGAATLRLDREETA